MEEVIKQYVDGTWEHCVGSFIVLSELATVCDNVLVKCCEDNEAIKVSIKQFCSQPNKPAEYREVADEFIKELEAKLRASDMFMKYSINEMRGKLNRLGPQFSNMGGNALDLEGHFQSIFPDETKSEHDKQRATIETALRRDKISIHLYINYEGPGNQYIRSFLAAEEERVRKWEAELKTLNEFEN